MARDGDDDKPRTGLDPKDLFIASGASAAAFLIVPLFWESGTLFATAMTPVIIAVARELLSRPVETAAQVGQRIGAKAPAAAVGARREPAGARGGPGERSEPPARPARPARERGDRPARVGEPGEEDRFGLRADTRRRHRRRRALRAGLVTGLAAFAVVAVLGTFSELTVFGKSFGGDGDRPTLIPGGSDRNAARDEEQRDDERPDGEETPAATPSPEEGAEPEATPSPGATPTPAATPSPGATPSPEGGTPAPAPTPAPSP